MINDTVGRASLLPRLSTSRNRVYPCTGYRSAAHTRFLCACTNVRHPSYQREAPISLSLVRVLSAPREAFISAYDSSNSASGLTTAKEFKMATLGSIESVSCEWQLSILRFWTFQLDDLSDVSRAVGIHVGILFGDTCVLIEKNRLSSIWRLSNNRTFYDMNIF